MHMRTDVDLDLDALSGSGSDEAREVESNTKTGKEGKEPRKEPGHSTGHVGNSKGPDTRAPELRKKNLIEHRGKEGKGGQVGSKDGKILSSSKSAKEAKTGKGADLAAKTAAFESARKKTRAQQASVVGVVVGGVLIVGALLFKLNPGRAAAMDKCITIRRIASRKLWKELRCWLLGLTPKSATRCHRAQPEGPRPCRPIPEQGRPLCIKNPITRDHCVTIYV